MWVNPDPFDAYSVTLGIQDMDLKLDAFSATLWTWKHIRNADQDPNW